MISASRLSSSGDGDGTLNLRGIATVLSLAGFLKGLDFDCAEEEGFAHITCTGYSLWAKDLVFVVSDGYLEGMQAWITAYHGVTPSSKRQCKLTSAC